jgi:hypothetical protein
MKNNCEEKKIIPKEFFHKCCFIGLPTKDNVAAVFAAKAFTIFFA